MLPTTSGGQQNTGQYTTEMKAHGGAMHIRTIEEADADEYALAKLNTQ